MSPRQRLSVWFEGKEGMIGLCKAGVSWLHVDVGYRRSEFWIYWCSERYGLGREGKIVFFDRKWIGCVVGRDGYSGR